MTNKEKYKQAFSALHAPEDISLEVKNMEHKKSHKNLRIAVIALAAVLVLSVGAYAAVSSYGVVRSSSTFSAGPYYTAEETRAVLKKGLGDISKKTPVPEAFQNGAEFMAAFINDTNAEDEAGNALLYKTLEVRYADVVGGNEVTYFARPEFGVHDYSDPGYDKYEKVIVDGITLVCYDWLIRSVPVDYQPTPEEQAEIDAGKLGLNYAGGTGEFASRSVIWVMDETEYSLTSVDIYTSVADLVDMAAELIG